MARYSSDVALKSEMAGRAMRFLVGIVVLAGSVSLFPSVGLASWAYPPGVIGSPPQVPLLVIAKGNVAGHRWDSVMFRVEDGPCNEVALATESLSECGPINPPAITSLTAVGMPKSEATVLSVAASSRARSIRAQFLNEVRILHLRRVSAVAARRAKLPSSLRVFAQLFRGPFCLKHYEVLDSYHRVIFSSDIHPCD